MLLWQMMASKFLHDEGEEESVLNEEWAASAHMSVTELNELERNFLAALVRISQITYLLTALAVVVMADKQQEGLAVASIARDDPGDDPFPRARMHHDRNAW